MNKTVSRFRMILFLLVMAALCGDYAAGGTGSLSGYNITLSDNIKESGNILAEIGGVGTSLPEGTHLEWFKSTDGGSTWMRIVPTTYAGGARNITVNTLGCNVALTDGARKENTVICYKAVLYEGIVSTDITSNVFEQSKYWGELQNGGFEDVVINPGHAQHGENDYNFVWKNAVEHRLELGRAEGGDGIDRCARAYRAELTNGGTIVGKDPFCPPEGLQFSEINCEAYGAMYQTILTIPGTELYWSMWHAARLQENGIKPDILFEQNKDKSDVMYVICIDEREAQNLIDYVGRNHELAKQEIGKIENGTSDYTSAKAWKVETVLKDYWKYHSNLEDPYIVPEGQYQTRMFFWAYETLSGNPTIGNLIDGIKLGRDIPDPEPDNAIVTVNKKLDGDLTDEELESLKKQISVTYNYTDGEGSNTGTIPFSWFGGEGSHMLLLKDIPSNEKVTVTISEDETSAMLSGHTLFTSYASEGGSDGKMTTDGYTLNVAGGQVATVTINNRYTTSLVDIIINKSGMKEGESAIFKVSKTSDESNTLFTVAITAGADGCGSVTIKGFLKGEYTVQEEPWSWAYNASGSTKLTQDISSGNGNIFTFTNEGKENTPLRDEAIKNNAIINAREGVTVNEWEKEKRKL